MKIIFAQLHCRLRYTMPKYLIMINTRRIGKNSAIIIESTRRILHRVVPKTGVVIATLCVCVCLRGDEVLHRTHAIHSPTCCRSTHPATDRIRRQNPIIQTHTNELVCRIRRIVAFLCGCVLHVVILDWSWVRGTTSNDFCYESAAERGKIR